MRRRTVSVRHRVLASLVMACQLLGVHSQPRDAEVACRQRARGAPCSYEAPSDHPAGASQRSGEGPQPFIVWGRCFELSLWRQVAATGTASGPANSASALLCLYDGGRGEQAEDELESHSAGLQSASSAEDANRLEEVVIWVMEGGWLILSVLSGIMCCCMALCIGTAYYYFRDSAGAQASRTYTIRMPASWSIPGTSPVTAPSPWHTRASCAKRGRQQRSVPCRKGAAEAGRLARGGRVAAGASKAPRAARGAQGSSGEPRPGGLAEQQDDVYDIDRELREAAMDDLEGALFVPASGSRPKGWNSPAKGGDARGAGGAGEQLSQSQAQGGSQKRGAESRKVLERASAPPPLRLPEEHEEEGAEAQRAVAAPQGPSQVQSPAEGARDSSASPHAHDLFQGSLGRLEEAVATSARQKKRSSSRGHRSRRTRKQAAGEDLEAASLMAPGEDDDTLPSQPMSARDSYDSTTPLTARRHDPGGRFSKWQAMEADMSQCLEDTAAVDDSPFQTGSSRRMGSSSSSSGLVLRS